MHGKLLPTTIIKQVTLNQSTDCTSRSIVCESRENGN